LLFSLQAPEARLAPPSLSRPWCVASRPRGRTARFPDRLPRPAAAPPYPPSAAPAPLRPACRASLPPPPPPVPPPHPPPRPHARPGERAALPFPPHVPPFPPPAVGPRSPPRPSTRAAGLLETTTQPRDHGGAPERRPKQRWSAEATVHALCVRLSCDSYLTILAGREVCYVF